jgi:hypothetical protein
MRKFSRRWMPHFLSPAQNVACIEASKTILWVLQDAESNVFKGIATGDESWFRSCYPSSTTFAQAPSEVISRTRQAIGAQNTKITIFFTARQLLLLNVLSKGSKFDQQYFIDYAFLDLKTENLNFCRRMPLATFWLHMDNSMCHNGSKVVSKFNKHHITRLQRPPYLPDLSPCDFWLFGMLKEILKDREFHSHDEIEEAITMDWSNLTFDDVQSVFQNWMNRLRWLIENGGEYITEQKWIRLFMPIEWRNRRGPGTFFAPYTYNSVSSCRARGSGMNCDTCSNNWMIAVWKIVRSVVSDM